MSKLRQKHDPLARKFLQDIEIAKEFLTWYLQSEVKEKCNFDTLIIESGSFVEDDLKTQYADIVYKMELKDNSSSVYIYILIEHQNIPVKLMPIRIIKYQLAIIQMHLDKYPKDVERLPLVVPLVFYTGKTSPYPHKNDIADLFADKELYLNSPLGSFKLADMSITEDSEILQHGKLAVLEMVIKHIHAKSFLKVIDQIIEALRVGHDAGIKSSLVDGAFSYLIDARKEDEIKALISQIQEKISYYEENVMTYAEVLKKEGEQKGLQLGEQKAQLEIAREMLKKGIDQSLVAEITKLSLAKIKTLH